MGVRSRLLGCVFVVSLFCLLAGFSQAAEFACEWRNSTSCLSNQTLLIRANSSEAFPPDNSHVQLANFSGSLYNVSLCCWSDSFRRLNNTCDGTDIVGLENRSGSHVQIGTNTTYAWRACYNVTAGSLDCEYPRDSCSVGYSEMFSMASSYYPNNLTNAHIGYFDTYTRKVCCSIGGQTPPTLDLVNLTPRNNTITRNGLWCQGINPADSDGNSVTLHYNWFLNGTSQTVLNMPMDYDSVNELTHDISGFANHGTVNGATFLPTGGQIGGAFEFDGSNNITVPSPDISDQDFSVSLWMKTTNSVTQVYVGTRNLTLNEEGFVFWQAGSSAVRFSIGNGSAQYLGTARASAVDNDVWYHFVVTKNGTHITGYNQGDFFSSVSIPSGFNVSSPHDLYVGTDPTNSNAFTGEIDELIIWNRSLTANEIKSLYDYGNEYLNQSEATRGDLWNCSVVPVDSTGLNGTTYYSNSTYYRGSPPLNVTLLRPKDGNLTVFERYTVFNWSEADEPDGDTVNYILNATVEAGLCSREIAQTNILDNNYTSPAQLCTDQNYKWNVTACDVDGCSSVSHETFNFTIASIISFDLTNRTVNFTNMDPGENKYTDNHSIYPMQLNNDGNVLINISLVGNDSLFTTVGLDNVAFQYRIEENESNSINSAESQLTYTPVPSVEEWAIDDLNFTDTRDEVKIHLNVTVPGDEPPGLITSNITLRAVVSE